MSPADAVNRKPEDWLRVAFQLTTAEANNAEFTNGLTSLVKAPTNAWKVLNSEPHKASIQKILKVATLRTVVADHLSKIRHQLPASMAPDGFAACLLDLLAATVREERQAAHSLDGFLKRSDYRALVEGCLMRGPDALLAEDAGRYLNRLPCQELTKAAEQPPMRTKPDLLRLLGTAAVRALDGRTPSVHGRLVLAALLLRPQTGEEWQEQSNFDNLLYDIDVPGEQHRDLANRISSSDFNCLLDSYSGRDIAGVLQEHPKVAACLERLGFPIDVQLERRRRSLKNLNVPQCNAWAQWSISCLQSNDEVLLKKGIDIVEKIAKQSGVSIDWNEAHSMGAQPVLWARAQHAEAWASEACAEDVFEKDLLEAGISPSAGGHFRLTCIKSACGKGALGTIRSMEVFRVSADTLNVWKKAYWNSVSEMLLLPETDIPWAHLASLDVNGQFAIAQLSPTSQARQAIEDQISATLRSQRDQLATQLKSSGLECFAHIAYVLAEQFRGTGGGTDKIPNSAELLNALLECSSEQIAAMDANSLVGLALRNRSPESNAYVDQLFSSNKEAVKRLCSQAGVNLDDVERGLEKAQSALYGLRDCHDDPYAIGLITGKADMIIDEWSPVGSNPPGRPKSQFVVKARMLVTALILISIGWLSLNYVGRAAAVEVVEQSSSHTMAGLPDLEGVVAGLKPLPGAHGVWYSEVVTNEQLNKWLPHSGSSQGPAMVDAVVAQHWCNLQNEVTLSGLSSLDGRKPKWVVRLPKVEELKNIAATIKAGLHRGEWVNSEPNLLPPLMHTAWIDGVQQRVSLTETGIAFRYVVESNEAQ